MSDIKRLLTPKQVAELDGVGMTTVYRRLALGEYEAVRDGCRTKITEQSVERRRIALPRAEYNIRAGTRGVQKAAATP